MGNEARRKARQVLALERPVKVHQPAGYGEATKSPWEYANTPFSLGYSTGGHAPDHYRGPHPLSTELDVDGTPHKHKPLAHRSRQWRKLFGKNGIHGLEQGMTFKEWRDLGFPKVPLREGTRPGRLLRNIFSSVKVDDQVTAYARKLDDPDCKH
jgi:hypothetical protein